MKVHVKSFKKLPDGSIELKEEKEIDVKGNNNKVSKTKPAKDSKESKKS